MSTYGYSSDIESALSDDEEDSMYAHTGARTKDHPRQKYGRQAKHGFSTTRLEDLDEQSMPRSHTDNFDTVNTNSKALTLRSDRSLAKATNTAQGRFDRGPIQRRHTFDDQNTAYNHEQPYSPYWETNLPSFPSNHSRDQPASNYFHIENLHVHLSSEYSPAPGRAPTFYGNEGSLPSGLRNRNSWAEREYDDYQGERGPGSRTGTTQQTNAKEAGNKPSKGAIAGRIGGQLLGSAAKFMDNFSGELGGKAGNAMGDTWFKSAGSGKRR